MSRQNPRPGDFVRTTAEDDERGAGWPDSGDNISDMGSMIGQTVPATGAGAATDRHAAPRAPLHDEECACNPLRFRPPRRSSFFARAASGGDGQDKKELRFRGCLAG